MSISKPANIHWLSDEEYAKAKGQLQLNLAGVFEPFATYGLQVMIPGAVEEAVKLAEDFGLRVRGIDKEISLEIVRKHTSRKK